MATTYRINLTKHVDIEGVVNALAARITESPLGVETEIARPRPSVPGALREGAWSISVRRRVAGSTPDGAIVEIADLSILPEEVFARWLRMIVDGRARSRLDADLTVCLAALVRDELDQLSVLR